MNLLFLVNPVAGSMYGQKIARQIEQSNSIHGIRKQVVFTDAGRLRSQIHSLTRDKDLVVICGGDGTVSKVADILSEEATPPPVAVIPAGTGNDMARATGWLHVWNSGGLNAFWAGLLAGSVTPIDLWSFEDVGQFLVYAGIGIDASIVRRVAMIRERFGAGTGNRFLINMLYLTAGLQELCRTACLRRKSRGVINCRSMSIDMPRGNMKFSQLLLSNISSYGGGCRLSEKNREKQVELMTDGLLETYIFKGISEFLHLMLRRYPRFIKPVLPSGQAEAVDLYLESPTALQLDGEWMMDLTPDTLYTVRRKRALPFLIPPEDFSVREKTGLQKDAAALMERISSPVAGPAAKIKTG